MQHGTGVTHFRLIGAAVIAGAIVSAAIACAGSNDTTSPSASASDALAGALSLAPAGFDVAASSFGASSTDSLLPWGNGGPDGQGGHHRGGPDDIGRGGHGDFLGMMGGGLGDDFIGGVGFGHGHGRGPFGSVRLDSTCTFASATGRVTCATATMHGLSVDRSFAFTDGAGVAQATFDTSTTNTVNSRVTVSGTLTRRDSVTTVVQNTSDRTVSGLAAGSTARTINGTSAGTETTTGTDSSGTFTAVRVAGDTTTGLVVPVPSSASTSFPYPTAGTVVRSMQATITRTTGSTSTSRREVVTYDGTATAQVTVTQDGTTKSCTMPLPHGHLTCQ